MKAFFTDWRKLKVSFWIHIIFYPIAPTTCTAGGTECNGNTDGLVLCGLTSLKCIGKLQILQWCVIEMLKQIFRKTFYLFGPPTKMNWETNDTSFETPLNHM